MLAALDFRHLILEGVFTFTRHTYASKQTIQISCLSNSWRVPHWMKETKEKQVSVMLNELQLLLFTVTTTIFKICLN
jgi:hypothetical protein